MEEWMETARWVKFEEVLEPGGKRWSKPRVATLSYKYLKELKEIIHDGVVILDLDGSDLLEVSDMLVYRLMKSQYHGLDHEKVIEVFLRKHHHPHEKRSKIRAPTVDVTAQQYTSSMRVPPSPSVRQRASSISSSFKSFRMTSDDEDTGHETDGVDRMGDSEWDYEPEFPDSPDVPPRQDSAERLEMEGKDVLGPVLKTEYKPNRNFLRKIPPGAEACNICVGEADFLSHPMFVLARLSSGVVLGDMTEVHLPSRFILFLLAPKGGQNVINYEEMGRVMGTLMSDEVFKEVAYKARSKHDIMLAIDEFLINSTLLPPSEWDPSIRIDPPQNVPAQTQRRKAAKTICNLDHQKHILPDDQHSDSEDEDEHARETGVSEEIMLSRTGKLFGGLVQDVKRKWSFYASDFKDALHVQCLGTFIFLYFAMLAANMTFGGLLGIATEQRMGNVENLLAAGSCGIVYVLFSGQPLSILGSTGPFLLFEGLFYSFCVENGIDYYPFRFWVGMWTCVILLVVVAFDFSAMVRYITKFTMESFAMLIAIIFVFDAFEKTFNILNEAPFKSHTAPPDAHLCDCVRRLNTSDVIISSIDNVTADVNGVIKFDPSDVLKNANYSLYQELTHFHDVVVSGCDALGGQLEGAECYDHTKYKADVFLFSTWLFMGTFGIIMALKSFQRSGYLHSKVRSLLGDFAVPLAIAAMVTLDRLVDIETPKLKVPTEVKPSYDRSWIIDPMGKNAWWTIVAAILPALLVSILVFLAQQITSVIVNRKENKLKKGGGYHLDIFIVAIQIAVCSALGLPWMVAATVRSMSHVNSLKMTSECKAPGEKPTFLGVREQRVTGLLVYTVLGCSVLMSSFLNYIPMPILYGVFLYMGVSSLYDKEVVQRVLIMFMPQKYQPDYMFLRHVKTRRVHLFTIIQIVCFALLWVVKSISIISMAFPLMVLLMCVARKLMEHIFNMRELFWLDNLLPESKSKAKKAEEAKEMEMKQTEEAKQNGTTVSNGEAVTDTEDEKKMNEVVVGIESSRL
ncbi:sodium bicarbonate cotransporter 3-like [Lingula anatina]|uniref:Anion exchange protein n=1 Tax=Lingula anatina TaxID=7574 RepID=A0A1S3I042_LINAN|nr:sodium bicarbonate cotransporter 3-like [Lingula anatina]|eukprot:XP_013391628.2 sodium bicarbonate cotransporter 3-like [Lingula anatina]